MSTRPAPSGAARPQRELDPIRVLDSTHLVPLPDGDAIMVGAPPEALKMLLLWEYPSPGAVVLPPDPLFADGINQASFEFLLFNHMFLRGGLRDRKPFLVLCDPGQQARIEGLARDIVRGPSDAAMAALRTPASHRKQLLLEMDVVGGDVSRRRLEEMVQVLPFAGGKVTLPGGTVVETLPDQEVAIHRGLDTVRVPRRPQGRTALPFYFAEVERPVDGPRFGLQVIGSASGFSGAEWSSCFVIWINGQPLVVDGTPYLDDHLARLGIEDKHLLGYLITHTHEDHANIVGQLVNRRKVTVLTSGPIMASLLTRMAAVLGIEPAEVRRLFRWIPLQPGLDGMGPVLPWFGAELRAWYSVHTIPTMGVEVSMDGKKIRMPGDTLWGRQLDPLLEARVITPARYALVQGSYQGADIVVADAGGGPIHPDPNEVGQLAAGNPGGQILVTHIPEFARGFLEPAAPGAHITLHPKPDRLPEQATALLGSPLLRDVPERWLLAWLYGGEVVDPPEEAFDPPTGALVVLSGSMALLDGGRELYHLERGDLFHSSFVPHLRHPRLRSTATWTRVLQLPETLYRACSDESGLQQVLERLYRSRTWWSLVTGEEPGLDTLAALSHLCRERHFHPGAVIVQQGDRANQFYIVTSGEVEVVHTDAGVARSVGKFGPGYHFGEIALLGRELRTASVRATLPTEVLELPSRAFENHLMEMPMARYLISRRAAQRRAELTGLTAPRQHPP